MTCGYDVWGNAVLYFLFPFFILPASHLPVSPLASEGFPSKGLFTASETLQATSEALPAAIETLSMASIQALRGLLIFNPVLRHLNSVLSDAVSAPTLVLFKC